MSTPACVAKLLNTFLKCGGNRKEMYEQAAPRKDTFTSLKNPEIRTTSVSTGGICTSEQKVVTLAHRECETAINTKNFTGLLAAKIKCDEWNLRGNSAILRKLPRDSLSLKQGGPVVNRLSSVPLKLNTCGKYQHPSVKNNAPRSRSMKARREAQKKADKYKRPSLYRIDEL